LPTIFDEDCACFSFERDSIETGSAVFETLLLQGATVMFDSRLRSSSVLGVALALSACTPLPSDDPSGSLSLDASVDFEIVANRRHPPVDARRPPADAARPPADAGGAPGADPARAGIVSCYTEGSPGATCSLPTQCCFSNYSAAHDGDCESSVCAWGTISCDGPEDCPGSQHCCAHVLVDPEEGIFGYKLACQAAACGAAPSNQELCHPSAATPGGTCSDPSRSCVSAIGNDNDLPSTLHICQ
jgi:hypothetical protein